MTVSPAGIDATDHDIAVDSKHRKNLIATYLAGNVNEDTLRSLRLVHGDDPLRQARSMIRYTLAVSSAPAATLSGQLGGLVLLHLIREHAPDIPVIFGDTGYHFAETLDFVDQLRRDWNLNRRIVAPADSVTEHEAIRGALYSTNPDACCAMRKVAPVENALVGHDVWFTAVRRNQSALRSALHPISAAVLQDRHRIVKVKPLIEWSWDDIETYADRHHVPRHPFYNQGYTSIGCAPCTIPTFGVGDDRSGRWQGIKTECGLHIESPDPR